MWTWVISFASLAFILQAAVGMPSFGTGDQQEQWNEVDDEHPGEIIPVDYMMPMRNPDDQLQQDNIKEFATKDQEQQVQSSSNTVQPLPAKDTSAPEPAPQSITVENLDKTGEEITKPSSNPSQVEATTPTPTSTVDTVPKANKSGRTTQALAELEEHKRIPTLIVVTRTEKKPDHLPAPNPTPRPRTEDDTSIDCECEECAEELQQNSNTAGNVENNEDCMEEDPSNPHNENVGMEEIINNIKTGEISPLSLISSGNNGKDFEDILKKTIFKSIPFSKLEENKTGFPGNGKETPKMIARIMMRIPTRGRNNPDPIFPFRTEDGVKQEFHRDSNPEFIFPSLDQEHTAPTIKRVLLKSIVPRDYFAMKDIFDIMKARSAASINAELEKNEQDHHDITLNPIESKGPFKTSARYIALAPKKSQIQMPPIFFPYEKASSLPKSSEFSNIGGLFRPQSLNDELMGQFIRRLKHSQNQAPSQLPNLNDIKNHIEYNRHLREFDPEIKNVMNLLLTKLADHESSALKSVRIPEQEQFLNMNDNDLIDNGSVHLRRRQFQMNFDK